MLYEEIDKLIEEIKKIGPMRDGEEFLQSMKYNNANAIKRITDSDDSEDEKALRLMVLSAGCISNLIVPLPDIINKLLAEVKNPGTPLHIRCAIIGALAYFVQPNDLIPDDTKGGYGFVDDAVLINAAYSELLYVKGKDDELKVFTNLSELAAGICPPDIIRPLAAAVNGITSGFEVFAKMPPQMLEDKIRQVISDPYQTNTYNSIKEVLPHPTIDGWRSYVDVKNAKGMSFEYKKGKFAAKFQDGSTILVR